MFEYTDLKLYIINTVVLALTMTEIELGLKIILLIDRRQINKQKYNNYV